MTTTDGIAYIRGSLPTGCLSPMLPSRFNRVGALVAGAIVVMEQGERFARCCLTVLASDKSGRFTGARRTSILIPLICHRNPAGL